ncbi:MAG: tetratricopeptide repeat protein [candidate division Zixibacteria bacterium]|nr:tetratricopeptide repeat protein [candidate division Zixibacteria bacterium]
MAEKKCSACGETLTAEARFCPACGRAVGQTSRDKKPSLKNHVFILSVLLLVAAIYLVVQMISPAAKAGPKAMSPEAEMYGGQQPAGMDMNAFIAGLPKEFESLVSMGNALMDQGRYAMAVECYTRALAQHPDDANVLVDLGACQHSLGQNQEAIGTFMKGLTIDPGHKIAKYNLGIVYWGLGDTAQARSWWEKFVKESPASEMRDQVESLLVELNRNH